MQDCTYNVLYPFFSWKRCITLNNEVEAASKKTRELNLFSCLSLQCTFGLPLCQGVQWALMAQNSYTWRKLATEVLVKDDRDPQTLVLPQKYFCPCNM